MPKSSPEKLAQALRANLKRRKQTPAENKAAAPPAPPSDSPAQPPKKSA